MYQKGFIPVIYIIAIVLIAGGILGRSFYINNVNKTNNVPDSSPLLSSPSPLSQVSTTPSSSNISVYKPIKTTSPTTTPTPKTSPILTPSPTPFPKITCNISTDLSSGWSPLNIHFSYSASDQSKVTGSQWDLDGDGNWESETSTPNFVYKDIKSYEAKLKLKLSDGSYSETCSKTITVNSPRVTCSINADVTSGQAPLSVSFVYGASFYGVTDDYVTEVQWDFNGDGTWDTPYDYSSQHPPVYTFVNPGSYTAKMHLKSKKGVETDICTKSITVN